jgi:4-amino-4-deoxy-L-arabinose transferase-like glycosyltransferase
MEHPDLYNPPLYPLMLAGVFKLLGPSVFEMKPTDFILKAERWAILPFNQLCLMLSIWIAYCWAKAMFDRRVAVMAGLLLLFSDTLWSYASTGLPTTFLTLLVLLTAYGLFQADRRLNGDQTAPAGDTAPAAPVTLEGATIVLVLGSAVLCGLCFLTRYLAGFLVIPLAIYVLVIMRGRRPLLWAAIYVAIFLAVITPWLVRNYNISGSFLGIARYQIIETEVLDRTYKVDLTNAYLLRKFSTQFLTNARAQLIEGIKNIGSDFLVFFFVVSLMYGFRHARAARLRRILLGCLGVCIFGISIIGVPGERTSPGIQGGNLLVLFLPLVAIFGVAFFYLLLDRITFQAKLTRALAIGAFVLPNLAPMLFTLLPPRRGLFPYPPYFPPAINLLKNWFGPQDVGTSDMPWAIAWYTDRRTLWLPTTIDEFTDIHDFVAPRNTQFLLLTPYMLNSRFQSDLTNGEYKDWMKALRGQMPTTFPFKAATPLPPEGDQILFADRVRWETKAMDAVSGPARAARGSPDTNAPAATGTNAPSAPAPQE